MEAKMELQKALLAWEQERRGFKSIAKLIDAKEEELERMRNDMTYYKKALEMAEERAAKLSEDSRRMEEKKLGSSFIAQSSRGGVYLPSSVKQLVDMITSENVRLCKIINQKTALPQGADLAKKNQELLFKVTLLQDELDQANELVLKLKAGDNTAEKMHGNEYKISVLQKKLEQFGIYAQQLREKNTSLLTQLTGLLEQQEIKKKEFSFPLNTEIGNSVSIEDGEKRPVEIQDVKDCQDSADDSFLHKRDDEVPEKVDFKDQLNAKCTENEDLKKTIKTLKEEVILRKKDFLQKLNEQKEKFIEKEREYSELIETLLKNQEKNSLEMDSMKRVNFKVNQESEMLKKRLQRQNQPPEPWMTTLPQYRVDVIVADNTSTFKNESSSTEKQQMPSRQPIYQPPHLDDLKECSQCGERLPGEFLDDHKKECQMK